MKMIICKAMFMFNLRIILSAWLGWFILFVVSLNAEEQKPDHSSENENSDSTMTDIDGNIYIIIKIGNQVWMGENLKATRYRDGSEILYVSDDTVWSSLATGAYCWCDDNSAEYKKTYGALYNFHAVIDNRCLCPEGWHVPTKADWQELVEYLGGEDIAGGKMKAVDSACWTDPNIGATGESRFGGLPGGGRGRTGGCGEVGNYATWWSSTAYDSIYAWHWGLYHGNAKVRFNPGHMASGFSVRCVKD